jgi:hypothetical protein
MARMIDLRDVLELVDNRFGNGAFAKQELVDQGHQRILHIALELGDELERKGLKQQLEHGGRDLALVAEEFAEQAFG